MNSAWLMLAVSEGRQHGGNLGYDDDPETTYRWDSTVPNRDKPRAGDAIAIWDKKVLLGVSIIESVTRSSASKQRLRCPECEKTAIKSRKTLTPKYRCHTPECRAMFATPDVEYVEVETYATDHGAGWVALPGLIGADNLRQLCVHPESMHSIRELRLDEFHSELTDRGASEAILILSATQRRHLEDGHRQATVRVRRGQAKFRSDLLEKYGAVCAFSGPLPDSVLDAAHLFSYAEIGRHEVHGGLLLRKDLHRLFDLGSIAVHPTSQRVDVRESIRSFSHYGHLHGSKLYVPIDARAANWLQLHWEEHRDVRPS